MATPPDLTHARRPQVKLRWTIPAPTPAEPGAVTRQRLTRAMGPTAKATDDVWTIQQMSVDPTDGGEQWADVAKVENTAKTASLPSASIYAILAAACP